MQKVLLFAAVVLVLASATTPPQLSCTFTAEIRSVYKDPQTGALKTLSYFQYQNNETHQFRFEGSSPLDDFPYEFGVATMGLFGPHYFVSNEPVLGHPSCSIFSTMPGGPAGDVPVPCFTVPKTAEFMNKNYCPETWSLCDSWSWSDFSTGEKDILYTLSGTSTPFRLDVSSVSYSQTIRFLSWNPTAPDPSMFTIPATVPCLDLRSTNLTSPQHPNNNNNNNKADHDQLLNDPAEIQRINEQVTGWHAGNNPVFDGLTVGDVAKLLKRPASMTMFDTSKTAVSARKAHAHTAAPAHKDHSRKLPVNFDAREQWPGCIGAVRNQLQCGSCWAFGATEALSDRLCIAHNGSANVPLSPQHLVDCFHNDGCEGGGWISVVWTELMSIGAVPETCVPYKGQNDECPSTCQDGTPLKPVKTVSAESKWVAFDTEETVRQIQEELYAHGPMEACFWVYADFMHYNGGIYQPNYNQEMKGGHCVKLIGWGEEDGKPFWRLANSWSEKWGENGLFRIARGQNACQLEDQVAAGLVDL